MRKFRYFVAVMGAVAVLAMPGQAFAAPDKGDENVRRLDIMLMVTSLRCRFGADNFQADYQRFSSNHLGTLNASARRMEATYATKHGAKGAKRALDKVSVSMANQYGQGHPWLGCSELKAITKDLASNRDPATLTQAADELLGTAPRVGGRFAKR